MRGSFRWTRFMVLLIAASLMLTLGGGLSGCEETTEAPAEFIPAVSPSVSIAGLVLSTQKGPGPLSVEMNFEITTGDPRANIRVFVDFGDGTPEDTLEYDSTTNLLSEVPNASDPAEEQPETRSIQLQHVYRNEGQYKLQLWAIDTSNSKGEIIEQWIRSPTFRKDIDVEPLPDLAVVSTGIGSPLITGEQPFDFNFEISNSGYDIPRSFAVDLYLVARQDMNIDAFADSMLAIKMEPFRAPGAGIGVDTTLSRSISMSLTPEQFARMGGAGEWYPAIIVDPEDVANPDSNVSESNEDNNFLIGSNPVTLIAEEELADVRIKEGSFNLSPTSTQALSKITLNFIIENMGGLPTESPVHYQVHLSTGDDILDDADVLLGNGSIDALPAFESAGIAGLQYDFEPRIEASGVYWIIVTLDPDDLITETIAGEENNLVPAPLGITVTGFTQRNTDILVENLSISPAQSYVGGLVAVDFTVRNPALEDTGEFECSIYISRDGVLDSSDVEVLKISGLSLIVGGQKQEQRFIRLREGEFFAGDHFAFVVCDEDNLIGEEDEDNNVVGPSETIVVSPLPQIDFDVENLVVAPLSTDMSDPSNNKILITAEICNTGSDFADPPPSIEVFVSPDNSVTLEDHSLGIYTTPGESIAPGACTPIEIEKTVSCLVFTSVYTVGLAIDPDDDRIETNEDNNIFSFDAGTLLIAGPECICADDANDPPGGGPGNSDEASATDLTSLVLPTGIGDEKHLLTSGAAGETLALCGDSSVGERDLYLIHLDEGDTFETTLSFDHIDGDLDFRLYDALDPGFAPITSDGISDTETLGYLVDVGPGADIILEVFSKNPGESNYYQLDLKIYPSPSGAELEIVDIDLTGGTNPQNLDAYSFTVTLGNHGKTTLDAPLRVYLSESNSFDPLLPPTRYITVGSPSSDPLFSASKLAEVQLIFDPVDFFAVDSELPSGTYYLIVVADPDNVIAEADESNNMMISEGITLYTECIPDAEEGPNGNDSFANASTIRPAADGIEIIGGLNACRGREDYYRVCVPGGTPINHVGALQASSSTCLKLRLYRNNEGYLGANSSNSRKLISLGATEGLCVTDSNCYGDETCQGGFCEDSAGEHCVYARFEVSNISSCPYDTPYLYELIMDTSLVELSNEPSNDDRTSATALPFSPRTLSEDDFHSSHSQDYDWYSIELPSGTVFSADFRAVDRGATMRFYQGSSTISTTIYPHELRELTTTQTGPVFFQVRTGTGNQDRTAGYTLTLHGIEGVDLVPRNLNLSPSDSFRGGSSNVSWALNNDRFDDTLVPAHYQYLLSRDGLVDGGDTRLYTLESDDVTPGLVLGLSNLEVFQKVYFREASGSSFIDLPEEVFGDFSLILDLNPEMSPSVYEIDEFDHNNNAIAYPIHLAHVCEDDVHDVAESGANSTYSGASDLSGESIPYLSPQHSICSGDRDIYSFIIPDGATYRFTLGGMIISIETDLDTTLYEDVAGSAGTLLGYSNSTDTDSEVIEYTNSTGSALPVFFQVEAFQPSHTNVYTLQVESL